MEPPETDAKQRKERDETDAKLLAERMSADDKLARNHAAVDEKADHVVEVARERAGATLLAARERDDETTTADPVTRLRVEGERAAEDEAVADEQAAADARLRAERAERRRALSEELRLEREATDDGLLVERARADEVVATRDDFLGMVSHDLRNMLGGITMSAAMLATHAQDEGGEVTLKHALRLQRFTARMTRLVSDLLDVVSLESGKLQVTPGTLDAIELVRDADEAFQPSFLAKGIKLTMNLPEGPILASFDHDRILQVLTNLLSNALKFTESGGEVTLEVARVGSDVRLSVTDTGAGIPEGLSEAIFERFRQVGANDRRGLGLGLYIAKCIVEAHGGRIWAESPAAGGAALHFTLPAAR